MSGLGPKSPRLGTWKGVPRPPRIETPGEIFHVASRGVAQQAIYRDDGDRERFVALLREVVHAERWRCLTYCLMGNHYHLLIQLREPTLALGMQRLNGEYARLFNRRYERCGHLFQGRFWSKPVRRDAHLLGLARYIALNPVQANLCRTADEWRWSAHRALVGDERVDFVDDAALLGYFHSDLERGRLKYAVFVASATPPAAPFVDGDLQAVLARPDRDRAIAHAHHGLGYPVAEIAAALGCHPRTIRRRLAALSPKGV